MPIESFLAMIMCSLGLIALFAMVFLIMWTFGPLSELRVRQPPVPAIDSSGRLTTAPATIAAGAPGQLPAPLPTNVAVVPAANIAPTATPGIYVAPSAPPAIDPTPAATTSVYVAPSAPPTLDTTPAATPGVYVVPSAPAAEPDAEPSEDGANI